MSDTAIRVADLGKRYQIGLARERHDRLTEAMMATVRRPIQRLRRHAPGEDPSGHIWALRDVSFDVAQGEVVGIIGRNGAGKSTLLKILSRITEPTEGEVRLRGRVGSLLEVGTGFHPDLTGRENVYLNGTILGMRRAEVEAKFDEIVEFSGVSKFIDTPVKRYSSGMQVRLAFAVAAHLEPEILLIDEVLAVGDAEFQKKCLGKMGEVAGQGRTVLFVSHNMGAVASLCQRGVVISHGRIAATGTAHEAIAAYMVSSSRAGEGGSLIDHPNRAPGHDQLLTLFEVEADNETAYYGKPLTLRIGYRFDRPINTPQFCVSFTTAGGITAFTVISDYQPNDIPSSLSGTGEVTCHISSLPLMPGAYTIDLKLWQPGQKLDDIHSIASLSVEWLDRELGQFNWNSTLGIVYVDATWKLGA